MQVQFFISILRSHKCGIIYTSFHAFCPTIDNTNQNIFYKIKFSFLCTPLIHKWKNIFIKLKFLTCVPPLAWFIFFVSASFFTFLRNQFSLKSNLDAASAAFGVNCLSAHYWNVTNLFAKYCKNSTDEGISNSQSTQYLTLSGKTDIGEIGGIFMHSILNSRKLGLNKHAKSQAGSWSRYKVAPLPVGSI